MFEILRKKISSYSVVLFCLVVLSIFLSGKIVVNVKTYRVERQNSLALLSRSVEAAYSRGIFPLETAMPMLEQAYRRGGKEAVSYAGFLASCFHIHNDPLRGAYYSGLAYQHGTHLQLPSPQHILLKEIADAHATKQYQEVLDKSRELLSSISSSKDFPMLRFLTLLRMIEVKESLNQDFSLELTELKALPGFEDYEQFYKDGVWTISKRYSSLRALY